jgi:ATP-dependent Clp protease ATP-binding subunit ClpA
MFEQFTDRARRTVVLAQEEARMLNHNYIGTEHLLLGLLAVADGVAPKALKSLGISLDAARQQVEEIIGQGQQAPSGHIPLTLRAKKVLDLAKQESRALGHDYIGTEHILLGLIHEGDGVAAQVLVKLGADLNRVRQQVTQLLHGYQGKVADDALALDGRLAAIERWVGMQPDLEDLDREIGQVRREKEAAASRRDFEAAAALRDKENELVASRAAREMEWTEAAAGRVSLARELGRVRSELESLRAVLREHGIEPGDDAA